MTTFAELDEMVPAYDELYGLDNQLTQDWYPQRVISHAQGGSLLELGVGHGTATATFARHFSRYQVVEGSAEMIKRFRSRFGLPHVDVQHAFFEDFDTEERFDHVSMGFVLEHVQDADVVLRRFRRFLKPDGLLFIAVPNRESLHRRVGHAAGLLPALDLLSEADHRLGHVRYFSLHTLKDSVQQAGYAVVATEGILLKPFTTPQMAKLGLSDAVLQGLMQMGRQYPELSNSILMVAQPLRT
jgi:ubiquinone/menaquinone biosynthesis C-methylase UbiE